MSSEAHADEFGRPYYIKFRRPQLTEIAGRAREPHESALWPVKAGDRIILDVEDFIYLSAYTAKEAIERLEFRLLQQGCFHSGNPAVAVFQVVDIVPARATGNIAPEPTQAPCEQCRVLARSVAANSGLVVDIYRFVEELGRISQESIERGEKFLAGLRSRGVRF